MTLNESFGHIEEQVYDSAPGFVPKRIICIPVDGSSFSNDAVQWTMDNFVHKDQDQIVLLNVRPFAFTQSPARVPFAAVADFAVDQVLEEKQQQESHLYLQHVAKEIQAQGVKVRAIGLRGDAREELVRVIDTLKPCLVVVGNRGLGKVSRALLGSVSDYLVHHLKTPVLIGQKSD
ncbi:hypothetical protein EDD86DRAFT_88027 [Gorgonomyces haynaldii]|nr:hypothetical protein EDD86DRAFT_88027 [Gorgonomyces haynaldii]